MMQKFAGAGGAQGIAIGVVRQHRPAPAHIAADLRGAAASGQFAAARDAAAARLRALGEQLQHEGQEDAAGIFEAQAMMVEDETLAEGVAALLDAGATLPDAIRDTVGQMRAILAALDDDYLRERAADMDAVGQAILAELSGGAQAITGLAPDVVLVAHDLTPAETATLRPGMLAGFATAAGGPTGHTAILARSFGIPAVVGLGDAVLALADATPVILDGTGSVLVAHPDNQTTIDYTTQIAEAATASAHHATLRDEPGQLTDGTKIGLWANIGHPGEAAAARAAGAEGIGLFRTEFLFLERTAPPTEDEQYAAYRDALLAMEGRPVTIRTIDIGGDKAVPYLNLPHEENPFLGVRGLRLCMERPDLFQTQLRALLRAAIHGQLWVMLPMVATTADLAWGRQQLAQAADQLAASGTPHRADVPLGVMIETPAAAAIADLLAREAAFFSIGSNDLTQYTLAADRGQAALARRYTHTDPAVFRLIELAAQAARRARIPLGICGDLGGTAGAVAALGGLGLDEISMAPALIPAIKAQLRQVTPAAARAAAAAALGRSAEQEKLPAHNEI